MKSPFCLLILSLSLFFSCSGCKNSKSTTEGITAKGWKYSYSKGACFGRCPVYTLGVDEEGLITFDGLRFVPKTGVLTAKLNKKEKKEFAQLLRKADMEDQKSNLDSMLMDAPRTTVNYSDGPKAIKLEFNLGASDEIRALNDFLMNIAMQRNWLDDYKMVEVAKQLQVALKPGITPDMLTQKFTMFKIQVVETIKGEPTQYKITWDPERIPAMELLNVLRLSDEVDTAVGVK